MEENRKPVVIQATEYLLKLDRRQTAERASMERSLRRKYSQAAEAALRKAGIPSQAGRTADSDRPALAAAAALISQFPPRAQASLLAGLPTESRGEILSSVLSFAALPHLDALSLQFVLRSVPRDVLARALCGASEELLGLVFANLSSGAADVLSDEIEYAAGTSDEDCAAARRRISEIMVELYESGSIPLPGGKK
jgi:flagellar motor switch protein FliG